ncbi:MAG TPA: hypothetical protein VG847_08905 [Chitinophagaceae bacterium]|nr:hypothetical protein [Chitinophagaceae bacterium]
MLSEEDKKFLKYWEQNRMTQKKILWMLLTGLPAGLLFALPILLAVLFHGWYKNMIYISDSELLLISVGVTAVAVFFAIFRGKFKWDYNEQQYKELKFKEEQNDAAR